MHSLSFKLLCLTGVAFVFFLLYTFTAAGTIQGLDSGEYVTVAVSGGIAHPPGYPLYTLVCRAAQKLIPFGNPVYRGSLVSALAGACTLFLISLTAVVISGSIIHGIVCASLVGFTPLFWTYSTIPEVFTGATFVFSAVVAGSIRIIVDDRLKPSWFILLGCAFALGIAHHHTIILSAPIIFFAFLHLFRVHGLSKKTLQNTALFCIFSLLGFVPYLILIGRSGSWTWGTINSLHDLADHFLRKEYGTFSLSKGKLSAGITENVRMFFSVFVRQFSIPIVLAFLASVVFFKSLPRRVFQIQISLLSTFIFAGPLFAVAMKVKPVGFTRFIVERFYLAPFVIASIAISTSMYFAAQHFFNRQLKTILLLALAAIGCSNGIGQVRSSHWTLLQDYVKNCFAVIPHRSIVMLSSDSEFGGFLYMQEVQKLRTDVTVISPPLLRKTWYCRLLQKKHPDLELNAEQFKIQPDETNIALVNALNPSWPLFLTPSFENNKGIRLYFKKILPFKAVLLKIAQYDTGKIDLPSLEKELLHSFKQCTINSFPRSEKEAESRVEYDVYLNYGRTLHFLGDLYEENGALQDSRRCKTYALKMAEPWLKQ
ncbi:MAG: DUF2723 domain-containing protein [Chitinispirillaceae bacterium]|nr:DUF2723 domain-containing protein [Chitinispirillaceae bacterium]